MKHREMAMGILKWTCQKILVNWIWNHVLNISSPTKKSTDYMTYIITHGPPQSPHRYTTNVAKKRINSFKWQVLNICQVHNLVAMVQAPKIFNKVWASTHFRSLRVQLLSPNNPILGKSRPNSEKNKNICA